MPLYIDAKAAEGFVKNTGTPGRMKHIDLRNSWVDQVRNLNELEYIHIDGPNNKADVYTKIIQGESFVKEQSRVMTPLKNVQ